MSGLSFLEPAWLLLAVLVPAAWIVRRLRPRRALPFAPAGFLVGTHSWRTILRPLPTALIAGGLLSATVALARPAAKEQLPIDARGIDIVLCLDTSSSMTANDMDRERTRLAVAVDAASAFIEARPGDRIGLVTFARYPDVRCPPTLDHEALGQILRDVGTVATDGPEDATGIGAATARAAQLLFREEPGSRVVILLTDGEENVAVEGAADEIPPAHAAQLAERLGVRVYAILAGSGERVVQGRRVRLDTKPIERLAERTGGSFHRARDADTVAAIYERIDRLEKAPLEDPRFVYAGRHDLFVLLAILFVLVGHVLRRTVLRVIA